MYSGILKGKIQILMLAAYVKDAFLKPLNQEK